MTFVLDFIPFTVLGIALLIAAIIDFKTREVPDWLSHALIVFGIAAGIIKALLDQDWQPFLLMLGGTLFGLIIGLVMFYAGQWGGGDSKLIIGVGSILGLWLGRYDLITFLINLLLAGSVYGIVWSMVLAIKHRKTFVIAFREYAGTKKMIKIRIAVIVLAVIGIILSAALMPFPTSLILLSAIACLYIIFYLMLFIKVIEQHIMTHPVDIAKLTEGDWVAEDVKVGKKIICGPKDLGVSREQLATLRALKKQKKIKTVLMKEGIPFVPSFFIAFLMYLALGNWIVHILALI
jgi:prepilin peptidase CpaA